MSTPADAAGSPGRGWLLMRHAGALWGVENAAVESLTRSRGHFRIGLGGGELCIDEVVGVVAELAVRPLAASLRRFWPYTASGLSIHAATPLVVVDPRRPPRMLLDDLDDLDGEEGDRRDG